MPIWSLSRRQFLATASTAGIAYCFGHPIDADAASVLEVTYDEEQLFDWSDWEKYRHLVQHPCLTIKDQDLLFARENRKRYPWAKEYAEKVERKAQAHLHLVTDDFLAKMIEETTPGDPLWTPCPACRDLKKPYHAHGLWTWTVEKPEILTCDVCGTSFPSTRYPEDIQLQTSWGKPQTLTYCGGDTFEVFNYKLARPSFTANIRSRKIQWMANYCSVLAEAFILTDDPEYAAKARTILLRFAQCYPNWLVHVGYGEYADMDPREASLNIHRLAKPEICPPPNKPDRSLWTGFWTAGRATGVGLESDFVRKVVKAYDLTCSANTSSGPIFSEDERRKIERDLLLESTILLVCDKKINNKSVSNRTAVALVGMCVGHPGLVRFGLEGFQMTVNEWFLPDGASSETPFYGLMTLGGIWDMAQASRGYSDPPGYSAPDGNRIDKLDLYHGSRYHLILDAFFKGLQGDLRFPPYADSFVVTTLDKAYVELMVANYPDRGEYLALLKELCGSDLTLHSGTPSGDTEQSADEETLILPYDLTRPHGYSSFSFYYRAPGLEDRNAPSLKLEDWCPEHLRIGHLRTGEGGRESLLLLSASHWGVHHELDSLNLYYWKMGSEILSDLGYLWDHPRKIQNIRTLAHNTVLIDERDQVKQERGGEVIFFESFEHVKAMEMVSTAYPQASIYRRTSAIIDHGNGKNYVIDFFRVHGGATQDYVFHGMKDGFQVVGLNLDSDPGTLYDLENVRSARGQQTWRATWRSGKMNVTALAVSQPGETVYIADGWGQRDWKNSDVGATIPYIIRRCQGGAMKTFVSIFEGYEGSEPFVKNVRLIDDKGLVAVETALGTDYIMSTPNSGSLETRHGNQTVRLSGVFAAASVQKRKLVWEHNIKQR